jgi:tartrate dehydrogenase/decarboxylase/D-malate dehydrogenase
MFEPVHGSAPDIAGQGIANPIGQVWSAALMLEHLGLPDEAARVMRALEATCADGRLTPDLGGSCTTRQVGEAILERLA